MKRLSIYFSLIFVFLSFCLSTKTLAQYKWHVETVAGKAFDLDPRSIAIDKKGRPHIAYGGSHLFYAYYDGTSWHFKIVENEGPERLYTGVSLALDENGYPHISYYFLFLGDPFNGNASTKLKYAYYDGNSWHIEIVDEFYGADASYIVNSSLSLDARGYPHISYYDSYNSALKYAYYDGKSWHIEIVENGSGRVNSLALDAQGYPHISYFSSEKGDLVLKYAYYNGESWNIETIENVNSSRCISLALDAEGHPHIVFYDPYEVNHNIDYGELKYAYHDEAGWHIETLDTSKYCSGPYYFSLALDASGHPHIAYVFYDYQAIPSYSSLKYAYYDGVSWHFETVEKDDERSEVYIPSIALDTKGFPHILYYHDYRDQRVLKYASYDKEGWHIQTVDREERNYHKVSLALDSRSLPHIAYISDYNNVYTMRYAYYDGINWHFKTLETRSYCLSLAIDTQDYPHIAYGYVDAILKYTYYDGQKWHIEVVDNEKYTTNFSSLRLDASDHPHIAYLGDHLKYAYYDGARWHIQLVDNSTSYPTNGVSLALDAEGHPRISYVRSFYVPSLHTYMYYLKYAYYDGTAWHIETVDSMEGDYTNDAISYPSLAIDSKGLPHIAYNVYNKNKYIAYLKYAYYDGEAWHFEDPDVGYACFHPSLRLDAQDHPHIACGPPYLYHVHYDGSNWYEEDVDLSYNVESPSLALDVNGHPHIAYSVYGFVSDFLKYTYLSYEHGPTLTIEPVPEHGSVLVPEDGSEISCGSAGTDCSEIYDEGREVTLYAQPDEGCEFVGWGGDCSHCGDHLQCIVTMLSDRTCSAEFEGPSGLVPVVKVNGHHDSLHLGPQDRLVITVSLSLNGLSGSGDYFLWAMIPGGDCYCYHYPNQWRPCPCGHPSPAYQGGLVSFSDLPVSEVSCNGLPLGNYALYFAVDTQMDGSLDPDAPRDSISFEIERP